MTAAGAQAEVPCPTCGGSMRFCECMDDPFASADEASVTSDRDPDEAGPALDVALRMHAVQWERATRLEVERDDYARRLGRVAGLLAAYGEAEGTPVDYEFLVHHISEAIK